MTPEPTLAELRQWAARDLLGWVPCDCDQKAGDAAYSPEVARRLMHDPRGLHCDPDGPFGLSGWPGFGRVEGQAKAEGYDVSLHDHEGWPIEVVLYDRQTAREVGRGNHPADPCHAAMLAYRAATEGRGQG